MKFTAVGLGIAEVAAQALVAGGESTLLDDVSVRALVENLGAPGRLRFAAYDGAVACGVVVIEPDGRGQATSTIIRFDSRAEFAPALQKFLAETMAFVGLDMVRVYSTGELGWLMDAGFRHDGQLRRSWKSSQADPATPLVDVQLYSITLEEARPGASTAAAAASSGDTEVSIPIPLPSAESGQPAEPAETREEPTNGLTH